MADETLKNLSLPDDFADVVADFFQDFRSSLADHLPADIRELVRTTGDGLRKKRNKLLRSLADVLSINLEKLGLEKEQDISVPNLTSEQRDYLWKTLHKLDLMAFIGETLRRGTIFTRLLQEFDSLEIEVGLFGTPDSEWYKHPYIKIAGPPDPDGYRRSYQHAIDPEGGQPPSIQSWSG